MTMRDPFRIDSEKMSLHPRRVAQWLDAQHDWEKAREVFPIYVEVSPVGYCNHACTFCGVDYMLDRPEKPMLRPAVMTALLTDMHRHGVLSVMFAGAGEPLLYKPLADAIVHADGLGLDTSITTNGVLLTEAFAQKAFTAEHLRWIKVSINAGDRDTYARIHRTKPEDFDKVLANLEAAAKVRDKLGSKCTLGAQMVALPEVRAADPKRALMTVQYPSNYDTAPALARRLRDAGVDYLVVKPYSQHLMSSDTRAYQGTVYPDAAAWAGDLRSYGTDRFNVMVRHQTMSELERPDRGYERCHATPYHWAYVEADGDVWGCSAYLGRDEGDKHYGDERFRYGNVNESSFAEVWRSDRRKANWEYVRDGLDISECRQNCRMHQVNLHLEAVLTPGPHANFI
jgi:radical SAM protein with 4Fe4S-binding SPASM domain